MGLTSSRARGLLPAVRRLFRAPVLVVVALFVAGAALATTPLGNPRVETRQILKALAANPESRKLTKEPADKARQALDRAQQARSAGDYQHATMLDDLALEWAQTARDVQRAAALEARATKLEKQAADAARKARRAHALLEETVARRGRARTRLDELKKAGAHPTPPETAPKGKAGKGTPEKKGKATKSTPEKKGKAGKKKTKAAPPHHGGAKR